MKSKAARRQTGSGKKSRRDAANGNGGSAARSLPRAAAQTIPQTAAAAAAAARQGRIGKPHPATRRRHKGWKGELDRLRSAVPIPCWLAAVLGAEASVWVVLLLAVPILAVGTTLTVDMTLDGVSLETSLPWIDNDYWWHLGTGNWVLDHWRVPTEDPFSWTEPGTEWVAHEWLAGVMFVLAERIAGYAGGIVLTAIFAIAGFWFLASAARTYGLSRRAICVLMLLWGGAFMRSGVIVVRPQVLTFAILALLLAQIAEYDTGKRRRLWLLPPLFAVWVNLNLTVLIGLLCLGAFGLDRLLRGRLERHLVTVGVLSGLALLVNPNGPKLLLTTLKYSDSDAIWYTYVLEWMSPDLGDKTHLPFLFALPVAALAAWQLVRLRVWPALPLLFLLYQSFTAIRFIPLFVMLAFVFAGWFVWQMRQNRSEKPARVRPLVPRRAWAFAPPALAVALVLAVALRSDDSQFRREPVAWGYPERAASILEEQYPNARLFNVYDYGGYLIYRFEGEIGVYVDGRAEMYEPDHLRHYFDLIYGLEGWREAFAEEGVNAVLIREGPVTDGLNAEISNDPEWKRVYADGWSVLYVKRAPGGEVIGG